MNPVSVDRKVRARDLSGQAILKEGTRLPSVRTSTRRRLGLQLTLRILLHHVNFIAKPEVCRMDTEKQRVMNNSQHYFFKPNTPTELHIWLCLRKQIQEVLR